jgi:phosphoribosyl 1,2-cyclic phosphate phosphodiesterase
MKFTFLGTGTSGGVPSIGCECEVCRSNDSRDKRLRTSALLETDDTRILIDCGPDFRQQILRVPFRKIDGVLLTHIHYDHVAGLDDLRPFCIFGDLNIYADLHTVKGLKYTMPYCFTENLYPGVPRFELHTIAPHKQFSIGGIDVMPIQVMHDKLPILGFRFGSLAYITDMKSIEDSELSYLNGVDTLVVNALRFETVHHSHQLVADAIEFSRKIGAKQTYFIHVTHKIGLHDDANAKLPKGFQFAYDGQVLDIKP